jgi:hypothetical protein
MCTNAVLVNWVARFGVPATITIWTSTCTLLRAQAKAYSTYSPHHTTHRATAWWNVCTGESRSPYMHAHGACPAWHSHLQWVLLDNNTAPKEDSAVSSAELVIAPIGHPLMLPGQLLVQVPPPPPTRSASFVAGLPAFHLAGTEYVYVLVWGQQKPLPAQYAGSYRLLAKGEKTFTI